MSKGPTNPSYDGDDDDFEVKHDNIECSVLARQFRLVIMKLSYPQEHQ